MESVPKETTATEEVPLPRYLAYSPVYIGTYEKAETDAIFLYRLNTDNGELIPVLGMKGGESPSYLATNRERTFLYTANELEKEGYASAYSVDGSSGKLTYLNQQPSFGAPCHVSLDHTNKFVMVANYLGGSVNVFPIQENGQLGPASAFIQHKEATHVNKDRQEAAHAHYITADPTNRFVFVVDLGADKIFGYRFDSEKGTLTPNEPAIAFTGKPGAGPRHLTFHVNEKYAYLLNELDSTMVVLAYDGNKGTFTEIESLSTLPSGWTGQNQCAAVHLLPNGQYLYATNRGHDSIVVYKVDESTGRLTFVEHVSTQGKWPRDFGIDLTGRYLIVANQYTNDVYTYHIDQESGKLTYTGHKIEVPTPVCVHIIKDFC